ncbi:putative ABC transporter D family member 2, chloroplastic [Cardiosporidium cionae]|uniref:ABC transporter D family member 2, chloroplastic n=1 Tax=Cardiosporidium cionae TaxID=476202 RepID=A0ABQ7J734_9APIC|nr:putative ABC transporter D family member 2, chloroplastic [Cardiosporidium cionae]|eukprot:KAF8819789.1 putative ABC transporter D family member 2, chloroplastic [Cardiosporidium cionae]
MSSHSFTTSAAPSARSNETAKTKNLSGNTLFEHKTNIWINLCTFYTLARPYFYHLVRARYQLLGVLLLSLSSSALSVAFSYFGRDFWNALSNRDAEQFWYQVIRFFLLLLVVVPIIVLTKYTRDRLAIEWRSWLTDQLMKEYYAFRCYYMLEVYKEIDNPDQRIAEDLKSFTTVSLRFVLILLTAVIDLACFTFILLSIDPNLFIAAVIYSSVGTFFTIRLGQKLISLSFLQRRTEADFRYSLVRVRENFESVAFYGGEQLELNEIKRRLNRVVENLRNVVSTEGRLELFTTAYRYIIQILPAAVVAPRYFAGKIELGVISQSYGAFNHILSDLSIVINQFESISAFSAGVERLGQFVEALQYYRKVRYKFEQVGPAVGPISIFNPAFKENTIKLSKVSPSIPAYLSLNKKNDAISDTTALLPNTSEDSTSTPCIVKDYTNTIETMIVGASELQLRGLTLLTPDRVRTIISDMSLHIQKGGQLLIVGNSGSGKSSLLRAIAGLWVNGNGRIIRPPSGETFFLPQKPYCTLGTLREQLMYPRNLQHKESDAYFPLPVPLPAPPSSGVALCLSPLQAGASSILSTSTEHVTPLVTSTLHKKTAFHSRISSKLPVNPAEASFPKTACSTSTSSADTFASIQAAKKIGMDDYLLSILTSVQLGSLSQQLMASENNTENCLDTLRDWTSMLSLGEQQRLAFGRLLINSPKLAIMDEATSALDTESERHIYSMLQSIEGLTYISVGHRPSLREYHSQCLRLHGDGSFTLEEIQH